jgi:hypothetical protein
VVVDVLGQLADGPLFPGEPCRVSGHRAEGMTNDVAEQIRLMAALVVACRGLRQFEGLGRAQRAVLGGPNPTLSGGGDRLDGARSPERCPRRARRGFLCVVGSGSAPHHGGTDEVRKRQLDTLQLQ